MKIKLIYPLALSSLLFIGTISAQEKTDIQTERTKFGGITGNMTT